MSRSGYTEDGDDWAMIRWRGAVTSSLRGKRGQAFLREALAALDALPSKELIAHDLSTSGGVCMLGAVGRAREIPMEGVDPEDHHTVAGLFGIAHALACEIMWENDEATILKEAPAQRWARMRRWIVTNLRGGALEASALGAKRSEAPGGPQ